MTTSDAMATQRRPARVPDRAGLSRGWRRAVLVLHILSAGAWVGVDVMVAALVLTGWFSPDTDIQGLAYRALAHFVVLPMLGSGLICLITGVVLGWGTRWGLLRYWWVTAKLAINLGLCIAIVLVLAPGMSDVDQYGQSVIEGSPAPDRIATLFFPPAVSLAALSLATALAVVKPWGRISRGRSGPTALRTASGPRARSASTPRRECTRSAERAPEAESTTIARLSHPKGER